MYRRFFDFFRTETGEICSRHGLRLPGISGSERGVALTRDTAYFVALGIVEGVGDRQARYGGIAMVGYRAGDDPLTVGLTGGVEILDGDPLGQALRPGSMVG